MFRTRNFMKIVYLSILQKWVLCPLPKFFFYIGIPIVRFLFTNLCTLSWGTVVLNYSLLTTQYCTKYFECFTHLQLSLSCVNSWLSCFSVFLVNIFLWFISRYFELFSQFVYLGVLVNLCGVLLLVMCVLSRNCLFES